MPVHLKGLILLQVEALHKCQITAAHTINLSLYFLYGQRNEATSGRQTTLYTRCFICYSIL